MDDKPSNPFRPTPTIATITTVSKRQATLARQVADEAANLAVSMATVGNACGRYVVRALPNEINAQFIDPVDSSHVPIGLNAALNVSDIGNTTEGLAGLNHVSEPNSRELKKTDIQDFYNVEDNQAKASENQRNLAGGEQVSHEMFK